MFVETRKTASGSEYWDAKNKKSVFVPIGQKPDFEVTENPKSMIYGLDLATGEDKTVINSELVDTQDNLEEMDAEQLLAYAKENSIDVPGNMKKAETIREHIKEEQAKDTAE
ncbi:Rho termination factor N-terminal domain-containing protein [Niallia taxi]|uniref:Rho termination factor N-terminal domain-containing protein n=1 Tax=Niallia taxi TaxID=2499688 RepID=UPI00254C48ED|nr:Rho termination factor N-terminal domain-containing protein [Niallia taxi]MDK8641320.1 Rho termination factor N-terminal domain-containing protein [Niallia taxi]